MLASTNLRLMALRDTPTVAAICGKTAWYSLVETLRISALEVHQCPPPGAEHANELTPTGH